MQTHLQPAPCPTGAIPKAKTPALIADYLTDVLLQIKTTLEQQKQSNQASKNTKPVNYDHNGEYLDSNPGTHKVPYKPPRVKAFHPTELSVDVSQPEIPELPDLRPRPPTLVSGPHPTGPTNSATSTSCCFTTPYWNAPPSTPSYYKH